MKEPPQKACSHGIDEKLFTVFENEDEWFVTGRSFQHQGTLTYHKKTGTYRADLFEPKVLFPRLAAGNYASPSDCPVDSRHRPKSDFLFLMALRKNFSRSSEKSRWNSLGWRQYAIKTRIAEREKTRGVQLPEKNKAYAMEIAASWCEFEIHAGNWLVGVTQKKDAPQMFRRFARWLDDIEKIEEEGIPESYRKFYQAVEMAASSADGVPTKKAVRQVYEQGMSVNQKGQGEGFRNLMRRLKFEWLPAGVRGSASSPKKAGVR
ncbi:MAG: hypothetical protein ABIT37_08850 [Luteolibacter sp.]